MFAWGETGFLFDGESPTKPKEIRNEQAENINSVACGSNQTVFLMSNGTMYWHVTGNEDDAVAPKTKSKKLSNWLKKISCHCRKASFTIPDFQSVLKPIDSMKSYKVTQIACGDFHCIALTSDGVLYAWSVFDVEEENISPIADLLPFHVIQVACGANHTVVLTDEGKMFSWGKNDYGQLGIGPQGMNDVIEPQEITALAFLPIESIACGSYHTFVITIGNSVYCWGCNNAGQLGLDDKKVRFAPVKCLVNLHDQDKVRYIACGDQHTVMLTKNKQVFSFGAGSHGQLGHEDLQDKISPELVEQLRGSGITQIACGKNFTLAFSASKNTIFSFGQYISPTSSPNLISKRELKEWNEDINDSSTSCLVAIALCADSGKRSHPHKLKQIFAGGKQCYAKTLPEDENPVDLRYIPEERQIMTLQPDMWTFAPTMNKSTLIDAVKKIKNIVASPACMNGSFLKEGRLEDLDHCVNMSEARRTFHDLSSIKHNTFKEMLQSAVEILIIKLEEPPSELEAMRVYLMLPECRFFIDPNCFPMITVPYGQILLKLLLEHSILEAWWNKIEPKFFVNIINIYKKVISYTIQQPEPNTDVETEERRKAIVTSLQVLQKLYDVNQQGGGRISYKDFYIPEISHHVDIAKDYLNWFNEDRKNDMFCNYPFVLDGKAKTLLLQADAGLQQHIAIEEALQWNLVSIFIPIPYSSPYLYLVVAREKILEDTIIQLLHHTNGDLKKPLRVMFVNEEAVDDGGVRKEFFLLVMREVLNPKYGMFKKCETNNVWFNSAFQGDEGFFYIVGILCGLAIYNSNVIAVPFPLVLYKKLLGEETSLHDLKDISPQIQKGLQDLLDDKHKNIEEVYGLFFEISMDNEGAIKQAELKENGSKIPVTSENKEEYVNLYVDYILHKSVDLEFMMFFEGFHRVCGSRILHMFRAVELMAMMIGNEDYDWKMLQRFAIYRGGYNRNHHTIKIFWKVFHQMNQQQKKKFLLFLTGTDRVPILGMKSIRIVIQKSLGGENYLPAAHTCFNLLHLPAYASEKSLRTKLLQAIEQTEGFGLV